MTAINSKRDFVNSAAEFLAGRRVLVTGGAGFIGANLVRCLLGVGAKVHLLLRRQTSIWRLRDIAAHLHVHEGDITDATSMAKAFAATAPEFIFHLARPQGGDATAWARLTETNVMAALRLVEEMSKAPAVRLVVAGSSLEYGPATRAHEEHDPLAPTTWHGVGKAAAGLVFRQASLAMGLNIIQLRLFHVYGPWESSHRLLPTALRAALAGTPLPLTRTGIRRDWIHVDDVVDALLAAAAQDGPGGIYNIGSGTEYSNEEVVQVVEQVTGKPIVRQPDTFPASVSDTSHRRANIGKAMAGLGWSPRHDLVAGVSAMLAWHRNHPGAWDGETGGRPLHV